MSRNLEMAATAWGDPLPSWVETVAHECDRTSQADVSKRLRYSATVINQVLKRKYSGSYEAVEQAVAGAFKAVKVSCPVIGPIAMQACLENQRAPYASTNGNRVRLYKACRNNCPHSRIKTSQPAGKEAA